MANSNISLSLFHAALRYVKTETDLTLIDENNARARSSKISPCPR